MQPLRILTVCTGNAGRSQIAQALARDMFGQRVVVESAGVEPWDALHPEAVKLLEAKSLLGKDQRPKSAASVADQWFDLVITMGDPAIEKLPASLRRMASWIHWHLPDPADADGTPDSPAVFRRTFEYIQEHLEALKPQVAALRPRPQTDGPLLGLSTSLWNKPGDFDPAVHLPQAAKLGFNALEVSLFNNTNYKLNTPDAITQLRQVADDLGMQIVSLHAPDGGGLAADLPEERQCQMDILKRHLAIAEKLGAATLVSHATLLGRFSEDHPTNDQRLKDALTELEPLAEASTVRIGFENGYVCREGRWAKDVLDRMGGFSDAAFGFTFDTGHSHIAGDLQAIVEHSNPKLLSLHLNDNLGKLDNHLAPGHGSVDWPTVAAFFNKVGFRGSMTYEISGGVEIAQAQLEQMARWHAEFIKTLKNA